MSYIYTMWEAKARVSVVPMSCVVAQKCHLQRAKHAFRTNTYI